MSQNLVTIELELHEYERLVECIQFALSQAVKCKNTKDEQDFYQILKNLTFQHHELRRQGISNLLCK